MITREEILELNWKEYQPQPYYGAKYFIEHKIGGLRSRSIMQTFERDKTYIQVSNLLLDPLPGLGALGNLASGPITKFDGKIESKEDLQFLMKLLEI